MSRVRLSLLVDASDPPAAVAAGRLADDLGIDAIWVADAGSGAAAMTILAALAAVTTSIRLGAVIGPVEREHAVYVAEELGVVDQASCGRLELVLRADSSESFLRQADMIRRAWAGMVLDDGRVVAASPAPHQPWLPMTMLATGPDTPELRSADGRTILLTEDGIDDPKRIAALIEQLAAASATELVVALDAADPGCAEAVRLLAAVVAPALAASSHEAEMIVADALAWYRTAQAAIT